MSVSEGKSPNPNRPTAAIRGGSLSPHRLTILSRRAAEKALAGEHDFTHVISIRDSRYFGGDDDEEPVHPDGLDTVPHVLRLAFDDMRMPREGWTMPNATHVRAIADFGRTMGYSSAPTHLMAHCGAGISRSPAAALIALEAAGNELCIAWVAVQGACPGAAPNELMLTLADAHFGRVAAARALFSPAL